MHIAAHITSGYRIKFTNSSNHGRGEKKKENGGSPCNFWRSLMGICAQMKMHVK